jgi:uncharacterized membrane protein
MTPTRRHDQHPSFTYKTNPEHVLLTIYLGVSHTIANPAEELELRHAANGYMIIYMNREGAFFGILFYFLFVFEAFAAWNGLA